MVVADGELMAVVDHVVVGDVFAIASRAVFHFCFKAQTTVHAVAQLDSVGVGAVFLSHLVPVIDAGGIGTDVEGQAQGRDSNERT